MQALHGALLLALSPHPFASGVAPTPRDPGRDVEVTAYLEADELVVGSVHTFILDAHFGPGADTGGAGMPAPILQLQVPPSVRLVGRYLDTHEELAKNEFLVEPYERLLDSLPAEVAFELVSQPAPGETIGINLLAYVAPASEPSADGTAPPPFFLRRRLELPLVSHGEAVAGDPTNSMWGVDEALLQIGDTAAAFELPRADGTPVSSSAHGGRKNLIVLTYRAFW